MKYLSQNGKNSLSKWACQLLLFLIIALSYQNCTPVGKSGNFATRVPTKLQGGNGDGYTGIQIQAPDYVNPGQKVNIRIIGGQPPYSISATEPAIQVEPLSVENEFLLSVPENIPESSFWLHVKDAENLTGTKMIRITRLPVKTVLDGYGGFLGKELALWNDRVVILGTNRDDPDYADGALFNFFYDGPGSFRQGTNLLSGEDPDYATTSLAVHENMMVTGNTYREIGGYINSGSATLFTFVNNQWKKISVVHPFSLAEDIGFGSSVSITKNALAVGSRPKAAAGRVHIYSLTDDGQTRLDEIIYDPNNKYIFGYEIKLSEDLLFVSGVNADLGFDPFKNPGHVDVFRKASSGWQHEAHLKSSQNSDTGPNACGSSLDYNMGLLVIGCPRQLDTSEKPANVPRETWASASGVVDIYTHKEGRWQRIQQLRPDPLVDSRLRLFGTAVSLDKGLLAISSPFESAIYLYRFNELSQQFERIQKITPEDVPEDPDGASLGRALSVHDNKVLVNVFATHGRYVYLFEVAP